MELHKTFAIVVLVTAILLLTVVACGESSLVPAATETPSGVLGPAVRAGWDAQAATTADPYLRREGGPDPNGLRLQHASRRWRHPRVARASLPAGSSRYLCSFGHPDPSRFGPTPTFTWSGTAQSRDPITAPKRPGDASPRCLKIAA